MAQIALEIDHDAVGLAPQGAGLRFAQAAVGVRQGQEARRMPKEEKFLRAIRAEAESAHATDDGEAGVGHGLESLLPSDAAPNVFRAAGSRRREPHGPFLKGNARGELGAEQGEIAKLGDGGGDVGHGAIVPKEPRRGKEPGRKPQG